MTRTRQLYLALALIATAALITLPLALTQGQPAGAQDAPSRLSQVEINPDCGAVGQEPCTTGSVYFVNYGSQLTDGNSQTGFDSGALPSGTDALTGNLSNIGSSAEALWAGYLRFEDSAGTVPLNTIEENYNRVLVVVEDDDQIGRDFVIVEVPYTQVSGNSLSFNYGVADIGALTEGQQDANLPIIDDNARPDILTEEQTIRNDVELYVAADDVIADAFLNNPANLSAETAVQRLRQGTLIQPERVSQIRPEDDPNDDPRVTIEATVPDVPTGRTASNTSVYIVWQTPREDNSVVVQITGAAGNANAFLVLAETERGSGVFVGELELADGEVRNNVDDFEDRVVDGETLVRGVVTPLVTINNRFVYNASGGDVNGVAGAPLQLPVENQTTISASYSDKIGVIGTGVTDDTTTRTANFRTDSTPPTVTVISPEPGFVTDDRRQTFEGTASDNQSGLQPTSLRLVIDNPEGQTNRAVGVRDPNARTDREVGNLSRSNVPALRVTGASSDPTVTIARGFWANSGVDVLPSVAIGTNPIRILEGTENEDNGLYAEDSDYIRGQVNVDWEYTPPESRRNDNTQELFRDIDDTFVPFTAYIQDLAGNIGYADGDLDEDGTQIPNRFELDGEAPVLIEQVDNPDTITFDSNLPDNPSLNVIIRTTRAADAEGQTQTGVTWDRNRRALVASQRAILVAFNDSIAEAAVSDFTVDFDTSGFSPNIVDVILPGNVDATIFDVRENNVITGNLLADSGDAANLANIISRSVFLVFDDDIPSADTPRIRVTGVEDGAGNVTANANVVAHDGIGPVLRVELSGGSGSGNGADGPSGLTNDRITITIRSSETDGDRPDVTLHHSRNTATTTFAPVVGPERAQPAGSGVWEYDAEVTVNGLWCVVVTQADGNDNESSIGIQSCFVNDALVSGAISFTFDNAPPILEAGSPLGGATPQIFNESRPPVVIRLNEEVQPGTFELRDDDETALTVTTTDNQVFVYRPTSDLPFEELEFEWRATDLAGNISTFADFSIEIQQRTPFRLRLEAGWNLISFPSVPVDPNINAVFNDVNIDQVTTIDVPNFRNAATRSAVRSNITGMLTPSGPDGLTQVRAGGAYWVFVDTFGVMLDVELTRPTTISSPSAPALTTISAVPGMNFVGVVDQSNQQTQRNDAGMALVETPGTPPVLKTVGTYLSGVNQQRVYTYRNSDSRFILLSDSDNLTIGQGLLVFIAPDSTNRVNPIIP